MPNPVPDQVGIVGESQPVPFVPGQSYTGEVTLNEPAGFGGQSVGLSASQAGIFTMPSSVTVVAGTTGVTFDVSVNSDAPAVKSISITASCNGGSASVSGKVLPSTTP